MLFARSGSAKFSTIFLLGTKSIDSIHRRNKMSTPFILRDFSFIRDFRNINWVPTIWYNALRAICAGLVIGILMLIFPQGTEGRFTAIAVPLVWPIAYFIIFLPMGIVFSILRNLPFVGLLAAFFSIVSVAIGDPIVCVLHKFLPKLVPVESPPIFSLNLVFWVLDAPEISIA